MLKVTLDELLVHPSEEVKRHAMGALKALQRHFASITKKQDKMLSNGCIRSHHSHSHYRDPLLCKFK